MVKEHDHNHNLNHDHDHDNGDEINCLDAIEQLYAYLDGELDEASVAQFEQHVSHCRSCYTRRELETRLNRKIRDSVEGKVPDSLKGRLKDLMDSF